MSDPSSPLPDPGHGPGHDQLHRTWVNSNRYVPRLFIQPVQRFMRLGVASGVLMLVAAIVAIIWANSGAYELYERILGTEMSVSFAGFELTEDVHHLINDGLMAIFFFVVGLEIKRELVLGELRDRRAAALPVIAAISGMALPAIIFYLVAGGEPGAAQGWAVPMATDIAFSLGVLSLLGDRVPASAKLFLLAVAIADDMGGILVIALFFTSGIDVGFLVAGVIFLTVIALATKAGIRSHVLYIPLGFIAWFCFLESGVHATIAGVVLGFLTPARPMYSPREFDLKSRMILDTYPAVDATPTQREQADHEGLLMAEISRESVAPLIRWEHFLTPWTSFLIVPLFALANAGVRFEGSVLDSLTSRVAIGVALGLVVGKTVAIFGATYAAVRLGFGRLPTTVTWRHVLGISATAGIGFTVALFITALAFDDPAIADQAKVGIFAGSIIAGVIGVAVLSGGRKIRTVEQEDIRATTN